MSETVLGLPELVAAILANLDLAELVAAAQVNHLWTQEATNLIWRGYYPKILDKSLEDILLKGLRRIADICSPAQRNWYTQKIRHLAVYQPDQDANSIPSVFTELQFPHVRSLIVDNSCSDEDIEGIVLQCLQPNIAILQMHHIYPSPRLLQQITTHAPALRVFTIHNTLVEPDCLESCPDAADFLSFLEAMPSIQALRLDLPTERLMDDKVWRHILTRPRLQLLHLYGSIHTIFTKRPLERLDACAKVLPDVRSLRVCGFAKPVRFIISDLEHLESADLYMFSKHVSFCGLNKAFSALSRCVNLKELSISFGCAPHAQGDLSSSALIALVTNCPLLYFFKLAFTRDSAILSDWLIEQVASRLPYLQAFFLDVLGDSKILGLSHKSVASFARHCPALHTLSLQTDIELCLLNREPESLRLERLSSLCLCKLSFLDREHPVSPYGLLSILIPVLQKRFPRLGYLKADYIPVVSAFVNAECARKRPTAYMGLYLHDISDEILRSMIR